ncbi:MAG: carbon monoxide dehydrogenase [Alphaproteobacteria bacterium]|nr:carbon monoxide dehydrogenase [Alphaproteobacteria bacterium]
MQFGGRYRLGAPRQAVWRALNDAEILKRTIPGCTRIDWVGENAMEAVIAVDFGVIKPTFTGGFEMTDVVPAESWTLSGQGKGGLLGLAHGSADVALADDGEASILAFTATAGASNAIMKLGRALIGNAAQRVIDHFLLRFAQAMGASCEVLPREPTSGSP